MSGYEPDGSWIVMREMNFKVGLPYQKVGLEWLDWTKMAVMMVFYRLVRKIRSGILDSRDILITGDGWLIFRLCVLFSRYTWYLKNSL
jgi:hypothetical protein